MKEQPYLRERSEQQDRLNQSDNQLALRAVTREIFESTWISIDLATFASGIRFHPVALAYALVALEVEGVIQLRDKCIVKQEHAERKILALRSRFLRVTSKPYWKTVDLRKVEATRFKIATQD